MNINIRFPKPCDQEAFLTAMKNSAAFHQPWVAAPTTPEAFATYLECYDGNKNISYLVLKENHIAGVINLNDIIRGKFQNAFLGYYAVEQYAGQGIMSAGLKLVIQEAFNQHNLHRLEANIQPGNVASIALVKRLGFKKEGYSEKYLNINGVWCDHERWAILSKTKKQQQ